MYKKIVPYILILFLVIAGFSYFYTKTKEKEKEKNTFLTFKEIDKDVVKI